MKLQEEGTLHRLKTIWWKEKRGGGSCTADTLESSSTVNEISLAKVRGIFFVLVVGLGAACVVAVKTIEKPFHQLLKVIIQFIKQSSYSSYVTVFEFVWKSMKDANKKRGIH